MPTEETTTSPSRLDVTKLLPELEVPFPPDQVRWRVTNTTNDKKRGQVSQNDWSRRYAGRLKKDACFRTLSTRPACDM